MQHQSINCVSGQLSGQLQVQGQDTRQLQAQLITRLADSYCRPLCKLCGMAYPILFACQLANMRSTQLENASEAGIIVNIPDINMQAGCCFLTQQLVADTSHA